MGEIAGTIQAGTAGYSVVALLGFMTVSLMMALILIGLGVRFLRTLSALKEYDAALENIRRIEDNLAQMTAAMREVEKDYEKSLAEEKAAHERAVFSLQQTIFERNSEILSLKTRLLEINQPYS